MSLLSVFLGVALNTSPSLPARAPAIDFTPDNFPLSEQFSSLPAVKRFRNEDSFRNAIIEAAEKHVGVMEVGGDNRGLQVMKFQYAAGPPYKAALPWCAGYLSTSASEAAPGLVNPTLSAREIRLQFIRAGAFYTPGAYRPRRADIVFFDRGTSTDLKEHIGWVYRNMGENGLLHSIEGNKSPFEYSSSGLLRYLSGPAGVRHVTYTLAAQQQQARILGYGNSWEMAMRRGIVWPAPETVPVQTGQLNDLKIAGLSEHDKLSSVALLAPH